METIILIALEQEAPNLKQYKNVFYTGVGKVNAAIAAATLIERYKPQRVINFGTAGGVTINSGLHRMTKFVQRDMICCELGSAQGQTPYEDTIVLDLGNEGLTCSTGDNFVTFSELVIPADVVDMEAYAIAKACIKANVEFICYKYITDGANSESLTDWKNSVSHGESLYIQKLKDLTFKEEKYLGGVMAA